MSAESPSPPVPPVRYWIRNEVGRVWGPFSLEAAARLDASADNPKVQASTDGQNFVPVAQLPELVEAVRVAQYRAAQARAAAQRPPPEEPTRAAPGVYAAPRPPVAAPGPPPPPVRVPEEDPAPPAAGSLAELDPLQLYARVAGAGLSGKLVLEAAPGRTWAVFFKKGTPERVECPQPAQELATFLAKRNVAPAAELQQAVDFSGGPDGDLLDALYALQLVPPQELFRVLGEHAVEQLDRALALEDGTFRWEAGALPPPGSFPLGDKWALPCRSVRCWSAADVRRRLGGRTTCAVYRSSGGRVPPEKLPLTAQEARALAAFDGTRSPDQIAAGLPGEGDAVLRAALLLARLGLVSFGPQLAPAAASAAVSDLFADIDPVLEKSSAAGAASVPAGEGAAVGRVGLKSVAVRVPAAGAGAVPTPEPAPSAAAVVAAPGVAPARPPAARARPVETPRPPPVMGRSAATPEPSRPPAPPPPAPPARDPAKELAEARELLATWSKATHFEVLGVGENASAADAKSAYFALARRHHPDTVPDAAEAELRSIKADLTARLNEAHRVLADEKERAAYLAELRGESKTVDIAPILEAEENFLRATILCRSRKFAEGLELLEKAIRQNPQEADFHAWRGWARFALAKDKRAEYEHAVADCLKALQISDKCVQAHVFVGQMSRITGDWARAEKAFRAALALDPENIEARRELRNAPAHR